MATRKSQSSNEMVVVGCKLPHGLIIHLPDTEDRYTLNGANTSIIVGGYGRTAVPKAFMDAWMNIHKTWPPVASGAIFVADDQDGFEGQASEQEGVKSGFEGADQKKPVAGSDVTIDDGKEA